LDLREPPPAPVVEARAVEWSDLPSVLAIERASFERPASEVSFRRVLGRTDVICNVATLDGVVSAFSVYALGDDALYLFNLATTPSARGMGLGSLLVARLVRSLGVGRQCVEAGVSEELVAALMWFKRRGFRAVPYRGKYVSESSMILMRYAASRVADDTGCSNFEVE
jgi:ribosomal protein S18 acetylase RimI-like enzyme